MKCLLTITAEASSKNVSSINSFMDHELLAFFSYSNLTRQTAKQVTFKNTMGFYRIYMALMMRMGYHCRFSFPVSQNRA